MIPEDESYDYAHFEFVMRGIQRLREQMPEIADDDLALAALRDGRDHARLHEHRAEGGQAHRA